MSSETPSKPSMLYTAIEGIGTGLTSFIEKLNRLASLLIDVLR